MHDGVVVRGGGGGKSAVTHTETTLWGRYWYDFAISRTKLAVLRVAFFLLIALDAWEQLSHAPRYGAGGFNVSHVPWLEWLMPGPSRSGMVVAYLLQAYLAIRIALGVTSGLSVKLLTALYAYTYLVSQLDSYQHHYFIFLLLVISCFIPWHLSREPAPVEAVKTANKPLDAQEDGGSEEAPADKDGKGKASNKGKNATKGASSKKTKKSKKTQAAKQTQKSKKARQDTAAAKSSANNKKAGNPSAGPAWAQVQSWAVRLLMVQIAVLYFWATITKLAPHWTDGTALQLQIHSGWAKDLIEGVFGAAAPGDPGGYARAAQLVLLVEAFLTVGVLWRKLWPYILPVGIGLHVGIEASGFRIGLFSYFMIALYVLMIPDPWLHWLATKLRAVSTPVRDGWRAVWGHVKRTSLPGAIVLTLGGSVLLWLVPLAQMTAIGILTIVLGLGALALSLRVPKQRRRSPAAYGVAHAVACVFILWSSVSSSAVHDYYKFWGGTSRRLGVTDEEKAAYRGLTKVSPTYGPAHYHLGKLLAREGKDDEALRHFALSQKHKPDDYRAIVGEAAIHHKARRGPEALDAAERALRLAPNDRRARTIKTFWTRRLAKPQE